MHPHKQFNDQAIALRHREIKTLPNIYPRKKITINTINFVLSVVASCVATFCNQLYADVSMSIEQKSDILRSRDDKQKFHFFVKLRQILIRKSSHSLYLRPRSSTF